MSFDDWVKEAKNKYVYVGFKSTDISPDNKKVKLLKHEEELYVVRTEHIGHSHKKQFFTQKINKLTSCCSANTNDNLDNNHSAFCRDFIEKQQENTQEYIQNQTIDESEKLYLDILQENIKKKQLENTLKIIKQRYHKNKATNKTLDNGTTKKRGRPKKVTI